MEHPSVILGKRIADQRQRRKWSKVDLARRAGVSPSYILRIERGVYGRPSVENVQAIADALSLDINELTGPPQPETADIDATLRKLIARKTGDRDTAEAYYAVLEELRLRSPANQMTNLRTFLAVLEALPDAPPPDS
jgi:transcriptional regulator with XRE-family HTH domain